MRASFEELARSLGAAHPPRHIWQEPFESDPGYYRRLCKLDGAVPDAADLIRYVHDIRYMKLQPDLLRFLLPICLRAWRAYLFDAGSSPYGSFIEYFSAALAARPDLPEILGEQGWRAVAGFMRGSILDRMDEEVALRFAGMGASPYKWFDALGSFAVIFAEVESLWTEWWRLETPGHARAALQYLSCLMYEDAENPIFSPWTPLGGGGAPSLFETDGHIYDQGWRSENIAFLEVTLSPEYLQARLQEAAQVLEGDESGVPQKMMADFEKHKTLLELRIQQLSLLLLELDASGWIL